MSDVDRFLAQNDRVAATVTPEQIEQLEPYAEHHSGGLYVLGRELDDGRYVKCHDSWGDDDRVVIHTYDPVLGGDDGNETEEYFADGSDAVDKFLDGA